MSDTPENIVVAPGLHQQLPGPSGAPPADDPLPGTALGDQVVQKVVAWGGMGYRQAKAAHDDARLRRDVGIGTLGVGAAAIVVGVVMLLSASSDHAVVVVPTSGGAVLGFSGRFR